MEASKMHAQHGPNRQPLCGARTRAGTPCQGWAMANGRCRMHGGTSLRGVVSPTYKHGLYSRDVITWLGALFEHAPDLAARLLRHPHREAVRVALVYKNEGKEAACRLLAALWIRRLERTYGSLEAAWETMRRRIGRKRS